MVKFKVFSFDSESWRINQFQNRVNEFLNSHEILDVKCEQHSEKIETWFDAKSEYYISYIVKYKTKNNVSITQ